MTDTLSTHGIEDRAGHYKTLCPQCSSGRKKSREKCLSVNGDEGVWLCHNCGWKGSLKATRPPYQRPTLQPYTDNERLLAWFLKRGIPASVVKEAQITLENNEIAFPYFRKKDVAVNIKYRDIDSKHFRQTKDAEKILYGVDTLSREPCLKGTTYVSQAIICEGEIDALSVRVCHGQYAALSVPDGAPSPDSTLSEKKFEYLANCADELERLTKIIVATDGDPPGQTLAAELARRLGPERCWRVKWPDGCKDANEVLMTLGADALRTVIDEATPYPIAGIVTADDLHDDVITLYREGTQRGLSTGLHAVDDYYTVRPGELTIITGVPSHGKSSWVDFMVYSLAEQHDWTFAIFSPENFPLQRHAAKLMALFCGLPFAEGPSERMNEAHLEIALDWLHDAVVFISPPDDDVSVDTVLALAKKAVLRHGIRGLVIDPWNELDHTRPTGMTETEYISQALTKIRRFSRLHALHVWVVAHPAKMKRDADGGYPVPTPYDISGSAHFRNKADNCLTVFRNLKEDDTKVDIYVQKVRFREVGRLGMVSVHWEAKNGRYTAMPSL